MMHEEPVVLRKTEGAETFERRTVTSVLTGPKGEQVQLRVAILKKDGQLRHTNFWDLDKTLLIAEPIHFEAVNQIFPNFAKDEESRRDLHKVYFAGFILGNSYREWDRMWRIYGEGEKKYKNPEVYESEFMGADKKKQALIDEPGHPEGYHERADEILQRYGKIAYAIMKREYDKNPEEFTKRLIKPETVQLLKEKTRLGQVSVYMTANQKDFARGLVTFSGLYKYGLALATDETMAGGGKEIAIPKLIEELASKGLKVNKQRATAIGDSIKGDVGSGTKTGLGSGIWVTQTPGDVADIVERARKNTDDGNKIGSILEDTEVFAIPTQEVTKSSKGIYRFGKKSTEGSSTGKRIENPNRRAA